MKTPDIYPILLAAGPSPRIAIRGAVVAFGGRNAFEIAVENCQGLAKPIVVLGHHAAKLEKLVPSNTRILLNHQWHAGQLSSLLAGLRHVPRNAAFMLYPVDHVFLTSTLIRRLVRAFARRKRGQEILMPRFHGRAGHPVIFSARIRGELRSAPTARDVVYRDPRRVFFLSVRSPAIWRDFEPSIPASTRRSEVRSRRQKERV
ncbi:MAG: nucleotidyltransferase family protein [Candidatus Acidiferrales bacterium]